jgi:threonine synthase
VSDEDIDAAHKECAKTEGILLCPEGAATLAALKQELKSGRIRADENVMLFNCATGLKYPMESEHHNIDLNKPIDYDFIRDC